MTKRQDLEALLRAALPLENGPPVTPEEMRQWIGEDVSRMEELDDLMVVWTVVGALLDPTAVRVADAELELASRFREKPERRRSA